MDTLVAQSAVPEHHEEDVPWLNDREQSVWRLLVTVQARLDARLDQDLQATSPLNLNEFAVLVRLSEAPGRQLRMTELAEWLALSPSGLTRRVDGLARAGYVTRVTCPSDKRGSYAALTDEGFNVLHSAAAAHVVSVRHYLIDALGPEGVDQLGSALSVINDALEKPSPPVPAPVES